MDFKLIFVFIILFNSVAMQLFDIDEDYEEDLEDCIDGT